MKKVKLEGYNILIGCDILQELPHFIKKQEYSKIYILTDDLVADLHLSKLNEALKGNKVFTKIIPNGEHSKSVAHLTEIIEFFLLNLIDRKSLIIAFGGGVIGDMAGFAASIILRGVDYIQIPTTLLSQVDSSVGGKTGVNTSYGKNLIGSFYRPSGVFIDLSLLKTLPKRQMLNGYAEVIKYGLIMDSDFFDFCCDNAPKIINKNEKALEYAVYKSISCKSKIVKKDEKETKGIRALLNLGHSFGHAYEVLTDYALLHGEALALGLVKAAEISYKLKLCNEKTLKRIKEHFKDIEFEPKINQSFTNDEIMSVICHDKKMNKDILNLILLKSIGKGVVHKIKIDDLKELL